MRSTILTFTAAFLLIASNASALPAAAADAFPDPLCPFPSEDLTFFPNPADCSKYYECYEGMKYLVECPKDTYFDKERNTCEVKQLVSCNTGPLQPQTLPPISITTAPPRSGDDGPSNDDRDPLCPYPSEDLTFYPTPDCSQYYECYEGKKYLIDCPSDTNFDTSSLTCEAKELVNCGSRGPTTPVATTPAKGDFDPDPLCPFPSEDLTFFPAEDCAQYWECYEGNKYLITCPSNTYWDANSRSCEAKEFVNCNRLPATVRTTTTEASSSADDSGPSCPAGSEDLIFYPAKDCSQYWECYLGNKYLVACPKNMFWNDNTKMCDDNQKADCNRTPENPGGSDEPDDTEDLGPVCPHPSDDLTSYVAKDCHQYWECYLGNKYLLTCSNDLFWNDKTNQCDVFENVDCNRAPNYPSNPSNPGGPVDDRCKNLPEGTFLKNPDDCSSFYECAESLPVLVRCPANTYWNHAILTCDYTDDVQCPN